MTSKACERRPRRRVKILRRHRQKIVWTPTWEPIAKNWAVKFIRGNQWRCDNIHGFDDLMQDAYLCFVKVSERYPRVISPKHFMALFKTAFRNQIHDQSRYMMRKKAVHEETNADASELYSVGNVYNEGYLTALLNSAPETLRRAFALVVNDPDSLNTVPLFRGHRENLNAKVRRVLGVEGFRFVEELKLLLAN